MGNKSVGHHTLQQLDQQLFQHVQDIEILSAVAPQNFHAEKQAFFAANGSINPNFVYRQKHIDLFETKRALYQLPVESLPDQDLTQLYSDVIESYTDKLDQFKAIGTPDFIYDSLRYYGEPSEKDIRNANFILHAPTMDDDDEEKLLDKDDIVAHLSNFAHQHGYRFTLKIDPSMIANALVSGTTVKINPNAQLSPIDLDALAHHEMGVHLVTTLNAQAQPLKILSLGSPVNTTTQEGLAILCEYLSGNLSISRLRILALRVIAVESLVNERDFRKTFTLLKEEYDCPDERAFTITARVYRGGGFTKDYLYLKGFRQMLNTYEAVPEFRHLLSGKTSLEHLPLISRLIEKGYLIPPPLISPAIKNPQALDPVKQFLAHAIK